MLEIFVQKALAFIFALGMLIIFHELGHYWVARLCGVKVLRFSVGMGKPLWIKRFGKSQTEWVISAIPLGGYVKFYDSREIETAQMSESDLAGDFSRKSVWQRIAIVAAGPLFNFALAIIIFSALFFHGTPDPVAKIRVASETSIAYSAGFRQADQIVSVNGEKVQSWSDVRWKIMQTGLSQQDAKLLVTRKNPDRTTSTIQFELTLPLTKLSSKDLEEDFLQKLGIELFRPPAILTEVVEGGPASKAGLKAGDHIVQINGQPVRDSQMFVELVNASPGRPLTMQVLDSEGESTVVVTPDLITDNGKTIGRIQVKPQGYEMTVLSYPPVEAAYQGVVRTWDTSVMTVKMIGKMLIGQVSWRNITGPITIADYAGQTASKGWLVYLQFIALISISLGVMNLLPIPVLDGGHLLYYSLEVLTGKAIPEKYVEMAQRGGLTVLLCLMLVAFFNDIVRQMS